MADQTAPQTPPFKTETAEPLRFGQGFLGDCWWFAALSSELKPGILARYEILGEPILIGRDLDGHVYGVRDICPHRAAPLSAGKMVRGRDGQSAIECPYHGWQFGTDGGCRLIPSLTSDQNIEVLRIRTRGFMVREQQGLVWIYMASDSKSEAKPDHEPPHLDGIVGGAPLIVERMDFESHIDHAVVGLMDPAHGPYVHQQWWWRSSKKQLEKTKAFEPREFGFSMVRHQPSKNSRAYRILGGEPLTEITFRLPGLRWEHILIGDKQILGLTCLTPVNANCTKITQIFWSDHAIFRAISPLFRLGAKAFLKQDGDMVNLQNEGLKYNAPLLWIDDSDTQAKWYQALKKEWTRHRVENRAFANPVKACRLSWKS